MLDRGFIRSSGVMLEVNDFGVIIGGETYQAEDDFQELEASDEVKLLNPSGPHFSLWDLPCLLEPRTKHAAAAVPGNLVFRPLEFCQHRCCRCHGRPPLSRQYAPESTTPTQCHSCGGRTIVRFEDYIELTFSLPPPTFAVVCFIAECLISGFVYVIGGCNDKGMLRTVEQYNMEKERWTHVKKLDQPVQCHAAAAHIEMVTHSHL